ncbi:vWA domain-containing protein [Phytoactinopolyspora halotolerans]|uniref:VWA domain-containing protein n=1 Tax=Phytoactinopolyspora halotolerans TaxID=1981512 RepID=A0A6L9SC50_9ACTN|nr:VWA domain-containing protein [Phytoactinopolyspora halotolerans]NEE02141.1 VWA domain-containing protein [Phytoactinopolyspora halotolerans]
MNAGPEHAVEPVVEFAGRLRASGASVPPTRVHMMLRALAELGADSLSAVYWSGRLTLCASPDDIERYDQVFSAYFGAGQGRPRPRVQVAPAYRMVAAPADGQPETGAKNDGPPPEKLATASRHEVLRNRDVTELTAAERAEVNHYLSALVIAVPERITRRMRAAPGGTIDARRTIRAMMRRGGEPVEVLRHRKSRRTRRLVFLIDVSGSMAPYADTVLRFAHAACRARPGTEVFTVGTRLTRLTRELRGRGAAAAIAKASQAIPDWSGGTRLGPEVKEFLDRWGQRGVARGAVVVLASDGWEQGDPTLLGEQMARLRRLARRVVWVNPHRGHDGYAPRTGGMRAALPHIDDLVAGHSLGAMEDLAILLTTTTSCTPWPGTHRLQDATEAVSDA